MTKNPFLNAAAAFVYIVVIGLFMNYITHTQNRKPDTFLAPVAILSLFTLSAAFMAYTFFYQPFQLYFGGKKKQALDLLVKTIGSFAVLTIIVFASLLSGLIH